MFDGVKVHIEKMNSLKGGVPNGAQNWKDELSEMENVDIEKVQEVGDKTVNKMKGDKLSKAVQDALVVVALQLLSLKT